MMFGDTRTADATESLAHFVALLKEVVIEHRRAIIENRKFFTEQIDRLAAQIESLEKSVLQDMQTLLDRITLIVGLHDWSKVISSGNGAALLDSAARTDADRNSADRPEVVGADHDKVVDAVVAAFPELLEALLRADILTAPHPSGCCSKNGHVEGQLSPHEDRQKEPIRKIDLDILKVASQDEPLLGKELAYRTCKYKFGAYFRSRLSYLCKNKRLRKNGEGYLLA